MTQRQGVAARLGAVATTLNSALGEGLLFTCPTREQEPDCKEKIIALADRPSNYIIICPIFFEKNQELDCSEDYDPVTTIIHELTHLGSVHTPVTEDYKYTMDSITLPAERALLNADSHALFARGTLIYVNKY